MQSCNDVTRLQTKVIDFHYKFGECWEDIPFSGNKSMTDYDMHCGIPYSRYFLNCSTMGQYSFSGTAFLNGCQKQLTLQAPQLIVEESCVWVCKHKRPVARCQWKFTHPEGSTDRLEMCWLSQSCIGEQIRVYAACKPHDLFNASEDLAALRQDLEAAKSAHREASSIIQGLNLSVAEASSVREDLEEAQTAHALSKERLAAMVAELNQTRKQLAQRNQAHADTQDELLANQRTQAELSRLLDDARRELSLAEAMLKHQNESHSRERTEHFQELRDLMLETDNQRQILDFHKATDRASEILGHPEKLTKERIWLIAAVVSLSGLLIGCAIAVGALGLQYRKWRKLALFQAGELGAHVVLGRPVGSDNSSVAEQAYPVKPGMPAMDAVEEFKKESRPPPPSPKVAWS